MAGAYEDSAEITGTRGKLVVDLMPRANLVHVFQSEDIIQAMLQNYWDRFSQANDFADAVLDDKPIVADLASAVEVVKIDVVL
ncbi:hypothetical protein ACHAPJ_009649 [Fusarium lateritium]